MSDTLTADTCVCGVVYWHVLLEADQPRKAFHWCRRCGSVRPVFERLWRIPLDRAGDVPHSVPQGEDDVPTAPGIPKAKKVT